MPWLGGTGHLLPLLSSTDTLDIVDEQWSGKGEEQCGHVVVVVQEPDALGYFSLTHSLTHSHTQAQYPLLSL